MSATERNPMMDVLPIGTLYILLKDERFLEGYHTGYRRYRAVYQGSLMGDEEAGAFLLESLVKSLLPDRYNAGFVTGWYAALFGETEQPIVIGPPYPSLDDVRQEER